MQRSSTLASNITRSSAGDADGKTDNGGIDAADGGRSAKRLRG